MPYTELLPGHQFPLNPLYLKGRDNWKNLLFSLPNRRIYLVEGNYVRTHFDVDFSLGGHHLAYHFIPPDEIWIENTSSYSDIIALCIHELSENILMKQRHMKYEGAHGKATILEKVYRDKASQLKLASITKSALTKTAKIMLIKLAIDGVSAGRVDEAAQELTRLSPTAKDPTIPSSPVETSTYKIPGEESDKSVNERKENEIAKEHQGSTEQVHPNYNLGKRQASQDLLSPTSYEAEEPEKYKDDRKVPASIMMVG